MLNGIKARVVSAVACMALLGSASAHANEGGQHLFILSGGTNLCGLDPDLSFRPAVSKALGQDRVIVVKDADADASIAEWDQEWKAPKSRAGSALPWDTATRPHGHRYGRLMKNVQAVIKGKPVETVTLVWVQGEADVTAGLGESYGDSLKRVREQLRRDLKPKDVNVVIGRVNDFVLGKDYSAGGGVLDAWKQVREAQQKTAEADPRGAWVDTDDLNSGESPVAKAKGLQIADDVLLSYEGSVILGYRLAQRAILLAQAAAEGQSAPSMDPVYELPRDGVKPASLFGHHMILQRDMPVPVWGRSAPKQTVTVRFAGHTVSTTADDAGRWRVDLPPLQASSTGCDLVIEGPNKVVLRDVLVGEVWVCSGQSNMQMGWGEKAQSMYNWGRVPEIAALAEEGRMRPIRSFNVPCNVAYEPSEDCKGKWVPAVPGSAVAFGFSYYLQKDLDVPVGVIVTCWGSTSIECWMPRDMANQLPHFKEQLQLIEGNREKIDFALQRGVRHGFTKIRQLPVIVYNAMMNPVIPYACRGLVWYQGEANADSPALYAKTFPLWVERLRKGWGRKDLHFLAVMLPGYGVDDGRPDAKSWALFREAQMGILKVPHAGVANTVDLGDAKAIHPLDKEPVCKRLSLLALHDVYGKERVAQGPVYDGFSVEGNRLAVTFKSSDGLKTTDGKAPRGFWISGKDGPWHPATASIRDNKVFLQSDGVKAPVACRYAFCGKPDVNLVNGAGLPAYPFRTDVETR